MARINPKRLIQNTGEFADVETVGIPRALLYWRYHVLWETFFGELGLQVAVSPPTDKSLCDAGASLSVDECCLASKIYMGHVQALAGTCDAVFVPRIADLGGRKVFCTKFAALPDLVSNVFAGQQVRVLPASISALHGSKPKPAFMELGRLLGRLPGRTAKAYEAARKAQREHDAGLWKAQRQQLAQPGRNVLLLAHPYVAHDPYLGGTVVRIAEELGARVLYADETDRKAAFNASFQLSGTMPWMISRELVGSALLLADRIDGAIVATSFPCGPDSMVNDLLARRFDAVPLLQLTLDAQGGTAGLETRIESFLDIVGSRPGKGA